MADVWCGAVLMADPPEAVSITIRIRGPWDTPDWDYLVAPRLTRFVEWRRRRQVRASAHRRRNR